LLVSSV